MVDRQQNKLFLPFCRDPFEQINSRREHENHVPGLMQLMYGNDPSRYSCIVIWTKRFGTWGNSCAEARDLNLKSALILGSLYALLVLCALFWISGVGNISAHLVNVIKSALSPLHPQHGSHSCFRQLARAVFYTTFDVDPLDASTLQQLTVRWRRYILSELPLYRQDIQLRRPDILLCPYKNNNKPVACAFQITRRGVFALCTSRAQPACHLVSTKNNTFLH